MFFNFIFSMKVPTYEFVSSRIHSIELCALCACNELLPSQRSGRCVAPSVIQKSKNILMFRCDIEAAHCGLPMSVAS